MADTHIKACLTMEQALLDFKKIILSLKSNFTAHYSPVVVMGGGYSGVLAANFRVTYPSVAVGALASSAPILMFGASSSRGDGYCSTVSKNFKDTNPMCYQNIEALWEKLDAIASKPGGLAQLSSQVFRKCRPFQSVEEIKQNLAELYSFAAQYDRTNGQQWINMICVRVNRDKGDMWGVASGLIEMLGHGYCFQRRLSDIHSPFDDVGSNWTMAWDWQRCNEIVFPVGCNTATMLPAQPFNFSEFSEECRSRFSVVPNMTLTSRFSSESIKETLRKNGSNIIFSNGLRDPFSSEGILEDISDTVVAIKTNEGTYQMDLGFGYEDDPRWLIEQREEELRLIGHWIGQEYQDSHSKGIKLRDFNLVLLCSLWLLIIVYVYQF